MFYFPQLKYIELSFFRFPVYAIFAYLAALTGAFLFLREARKRQLDTKHSWFIVIFSVIGLVIGARLFYYFGPWSWHKDYTLPIRMMKFFSFLGPGLVFYGGLLGAILAIFLYCKLKKVNFWKYSDAFAIYAPLIIIIGRLGCFVSNDSCRGIATDVSWAIVRYTGDKITTEALHPTRLYTIIAMLVLFFALKRLDKKKMFDGYLSLVFLMSYSAIRFIIEFFRAYKWHLFGLTASQIISIVVFVGSFIIFKKLSKAS